MRLKIEDLNLCELKIRNTFNRYTFLYSLETTLLVSFIPKVSGYNPFKSCSLKAEFKYGNLFDFVLFYFVLLSVRLHYSGPAFSERQRERYHSTEAAPNTVGARLKPGHMEKQAHYASKLFCWLIYIFSLEIIWLYSVGI